MKTTGQVAYETAFARRPDISGDYDDPSMGTNLSRRGTWDQQDATVQSYWQAVADAVGNQIANPV